MRCCTTMWIIHLMVSGASTKTMEYANRSIFTEGKMMKQWPRFTVLRGEVVWDKDNGGIIKPKGYGKFLKRGPSTLAGPRSKDEWNVENF